MYEVLSKIFRTGAAIYTAVVIAPVPKGQTVNSGFQCEVLRRLRKNMRRRRPNFGEKIWLLHHDNAPSHNSAFTQQFLAKLEMAVIRHPPYSSDLLPCDFFLFPKMKLMLKRRRFDTIKEIQAESQRVLDAVTCRTYRKRSKNGGDGGTGVYMREGTASWVMATYRPYGEFFYFYSVSSEYFEYTLVCISDKNGLSVATVDTRTRHVVTLHVALHM
jgi:hypothetical protein